MSPLVASIPTLSNQLIIHIPAHIFDAALFIVQFQKICSKDLPLCHWKSCLSSTARVPQSHRERGEVETIRLLDGSAECTMSLVESSAFSRPSADILISPFYS